MPVLNVEARNESDITTRQFARHAVNAASSGQVQLQWLDKRQRQPQTGLTGEKCLDHDFEMEFVMERAAQGVNRSSKTQADIDS